MENDNFLHMEHLLPIVNKCWRVPAEAPPFNSMDTVPVEDSGAQTMGSIDPTSKVEPEAGLLRTSKPSVGVCA